MSPTTLKPCPFCGSAAAKSYDPFLEITSYLCDNPRCGVQAAFLGSAVRTREDSDRAWNARTADSKPV